MSNFYYDYKLNRCQLMQIPVTPHWAVMIITTRSADDGYGGRSDYQEVEYYHFDSEETWTKMISDVYQENYASYGKPKMVFFKSSGQGKLKVSVDVKVEP